MTISKNTFKKKKGLNHKERLNKDLKYIQMAQRIPMAEKTNMINQDMTRKNHRDIYFKEDLMLLGIEDFFLVIVFPATILDIML
jgi:hypothetical protein